MLFRKKKYDLFHALTENVRLNPNEAIVTREFLAFHSPTHEKTLFVLGDHRHLNGEELCRLIGEKNKAVLT